MKVAFIFTVNQILASRNKLKHNNFKPSKRNSINLIQNQTMFSDNKVPNLTSILIADFALIKAFGVQIRPPRAPNITEVLWSPPNLGWVKGNCDNFYCHNTNVNGCGCIFKDTNGDFSLAFIEKLHIGSLFTAEFFAVLRAIGIAMSRGWRKLWIKTDFLLVVKTCSNHRLLPICLRNRWLESSSPSNFTNLIITYIFREENSCAGFFANLCINENSLITFASISIRIIGYFVKNELGIHLFKFSNF